MAHEETMLMNAIYLQYLFGEFPVANQSHPNCWGFQAFRPNARVRCSSTETRRVETDLCDMEMKCETRRRNKAYGWKTMPRMKICCAAQWNVEKQLC